MPRINLLPWREQQRNERKKAFAVSMFGAAIAAVAVALVGWFFVNQMIDAQRDRNELLRSEIKVLDKMNEEINSLEEQKKQHIERMNIIEKLQRSRPEIVHVFDTFTKIIPDGVYLTSLRQAERTTGQDTVKTYRIQGITQSSTRVGTFMRAIEGSEWLRKGDLEKMEATRGGSQTLSFILTAEQRTQAAK
jgi:type IV pilus assembly protein PilN